MHRLRWPKRPAITATAHRARRWWTAAAIRSTVLGAVLLLVAAIAASTGREGTDFGPATRVTSEDSPAAVAVDTRSAALSNDPVATRERTVARDPADSRSGREMFATPVSATTVEDLLEAGMALAGASPVHLAIRGTAGADTARCAWRGIARTATQREDAIRAWLQLQDGDPLPSVRDLEVLFTATFDGLNPKYRETVKSNFLAIARGGLSEEYLFVTCFADYTVSSYLLGTGTTPGTVTVAYDQAG